MSVVVAAIAVFPVLTLLMIGLAKAENVLSGPVAPSLTRSTPADLAAPAAAPAGEATLG